ncbi:MAG: hypothetical protein SV760_00375 [Halobacteria archaeon]|nr:hypothetical protein [Halobacteria archaeon]
MRTIEKTQHECPKCGSRMYATTRGQDWMICGGCNYFSTKGETEFEISVSDDGETAEAR